MWPYYFTSPQVSESRDLAMSSWHWSSSHFLAWAILLSIQWCLLAALLCISLGTNDVEHYFIYFLGICISLGSACSNLLPIKWLVFLLLSCRSFLYIVNSGPLSDTCFVNIFSQTVAYRLVFLMKSFNEQKFLILMKSDYQVFLLYLCFSAF